MDLADIRAGRQRVLIYAESCGIGEVGAELAHELEDAGILSIANNRESSLQRGVWDEGA